MTTPPLDPPDWVTRNFNSKHVGGYIIHTQKTDDELRRQAEATPPLKLTALKEIAEAAPNTSWDAATTGPMSGNHWYVMDAGTREHVAMIAAQDGINEAEREPIAQHIAAFDPPTVLHLIETVEYEREATNGFCADRNLWRDRAEAAEKAVAKVRQVHSQKVTDRWRQRSTGDTNAGEWVTVLMCAGCSANYPCATITALDGTP